MGYYSAVNEVLQDIKGGIKMTSMYDNDVSEVWQIHKWVTTVLSMRYYKTSKEVSK